MTNKKHEEAACITDEARSNKRGQSVDPSARPAAQAEDTAPKSVKHGRPISEAAYRRQKERAEHAPGAPNAHAQKDPST